MKVIVILLSLCWAGFTYSQATCTTVISPADGEVDVALDTGLEWTPVEGINAYLVTIGTTPGGGEILFQQNVGLLTTFQPELPLPANTRIYVRISLFFFNSDRIDCEETDFLTQPFERPPDCTTLSFPAPNTTNAATSTFLQWEAVPGATSYTVSAGTFPGGTDLVNAFDNGNDLRFFPDTEWPTNTTIYVRIIPRNSFGEALGCDTFSFTTRDAAPLPNCTSLITPSNGAINVPLSPIIEWEAVPDASGYILNIGTTPGGRDILDAVNFGNVTSTPVIDFLPNVTAFVTIIPYNSTGEAIGCNEEFFSTAPGCGPYLDPESGLLVDLNPVISIPEQLSICRNNLSQPLQASTEEDVEITWTFLGTNGSRELVSETNEFLPQESGTYEVRAVRVLPQGENFELRCESETTVEIIISEDPNIEDIILTMEGGGLRIRVLPGDDRPYEYSLTEEGPFTLSNELFTSDLSNIQLFVRDPQGCGTVEIPLDDLQYPNFFSPNGDTANPFWQARYYTEAQGRALRTEIYDRYGKLLVQLDPYGEGWDGTFRGYPLPESDYWFITYFESGQVVRGHFALLR